MRLYVVYRDHEATFSNLLSKDNAVATHERYLPIVATAFFKRRKWIKSRINGRNIYILRYGLNLLSHTSLEVGRLKF